MRTFAVAAVGTLLLLAPRAARAQDSTRTDPDRWQIQTETGDYIWDIRLLRLHPDNLGQGSSDELMYWSQYRRATGFQVWVPGQGVKAELLDPAGGVVADQILSTLHRS